MSRKEHPSTKLCKHCKTEIPYDAKVCPNCRKKQGMALWLKILIAFLVIGMLGGIFGGSSDEPTNTNPENSQETANKGEEVEPTPAPEEVTYGIGETVKVGDVEFTVNSIDVSKTYGSEYFNTEAQEVFLVLNVSIKNCGNDSLNVADGFFKLKNGEKTYECDTESALYVPDQAILFETINPDATLSGNVLFDITQETADAPELLLQVQTGVWGTETGLIKLH